MFLHNPSRSTKTSNRHGQRPILVALLVFLLSVIATGTFIWRLECYRLLEERARVSSLASDHAYDLQRRLDQAFSATYTLAALVREGHGNIKDFDEVARQLLPFYPGVSGLQLAPAGVIRQVAPLAGNEAAIGHDLLKDPARDKEARIARDTGKLTLAGPFNLIQGGVGAVARLPVLLDNEQGKPVFWGFTNVLIRFPDVLTEVLLSKLSERNFCYELWRIHPDTGKKQVIATSSFDPLIEPVERNISVPNGTWMLSVAPIKGWINPAGLSIKVALGLLFCLLLAWLIKLLLESKTLKADLEEQVRARTAELESSMAQLRESEFLFRSQFDLGNIGIAITSTDRGWLRANARLCHMLGYSEKELRQRTWDEMTHSDDLINNLKQFKKLLSGEIDGYELDKRFIRKDGEIVHTHLTVACYRSDGQVQFVISSIQDITERMQSEEKLRLAQFCIEHVAIGIFQIDEDGRITSVNSHTCQTLGYSRDELCALSVFDIDPTFSRENWLLHRKNIRARGSGTIETIHRRKDGSVFPVEVTVSYMEYEGEPISFSFTRDISERKRSEEEIRTINSELEQRIENRTRELEETKMSLMNNVKDLSLKTDELAAANERLKEIDRLKSMFIASMSHELRTPLNSVIGFSSILSNGWIGPVNDEQRKCLSSILSSGKHLLSLINDVIDVSKIESGIIEVASDHFDLADLLAELEQTVAMDVQKSGLYLTVQKLHLPMLTDRRRLLQCLLNLVSNAIKFTEHGGVTVAVSYDEESAELSISVSDTGIGINELDLANLFLPFSRIHSPISSKVLGTGLGLYLTKKMVTEILHGSIRITSEHGIGSTFSFTVPSRVKV